MRIPERFPGGEENGRSNSVVKKIWDEFGSKMLTKAAKTYMLVRL